jgi:sugar lactone lactonase YvrE
MRSLPAFTLKVISVLLVGAVLQSAADTPNAIIQTVAGNGTSGFSGDNGAAATASLSEPFGVVVDTAGNLYIADTSNHRIRKVNTSGVITTVAGNGTEGFSGDGGPATSAALNTPIGVAVDMAGNLYIADAFNNRIREVDATGIIRTVAGNGDAHFSGDHAAATSASLSAPFGVAVDKAGNLYIADTSNQRIRKVNTSGTIATVAGNGTEGFSGDGGSATRASLNFPTGVTLDRAGNLFVTDQSNHRIRKVTTRGVITTVAGNGEAGFSGDQAAATSASLNLPIGTAVDAAGMLYIADTSNHRIRRVSSDGTVTTVAGNGVGAFSGDGNTATRATLNSPSGVAVDSAGNLYIADSFNNRIRRLNAVPSTTGDRGLPYKCSSWPQSALWEAAVAFWVDGQPSGGHLTPAAHNKILTGLAATAATISLSGWCHSPKLRPTSFAAVTLLRR